MSDGPEVIVVGAGAAGLWAAAVSARAGRRTLVLEKTPRAGTKVLASGGSRCNLTTSLPPLEAARLFGTKGERFLRRAFSSLPPIAVRGHFEALGVPTEEAPLDKVFPSSQRAVDVRDALLRDAHDAGAEFRYDCAVRDVRKEGDAWCVELADGEVVRAARLLLSPGGMSYARTGTTGDGYAWLERLGCELVEPVPALAPLSSDAEWVHELSGIAVQDAVCKLTDVSGKVLGRRERPVLFTHRGLSGPGAMDLSVHVARALAEAARKGRALPSFWFSIDLCPLLDRDELRRRLIEAAGRPGNPRLARALDGDLPRRLIDAACRQAGLDPNPLAASISKPQRHGLVEALKGLDVPISGTLGFDLAEVTAGGLALHEVSPATMEVRGQPGLYVFGELLDLDGPIGGLNFQSAFATAELAGKSAAS
jgi:predicted Rossmann fold flavoprotein